jgi:hypothetical protein
MFVWMIWCENSNDLSACLTASLFRQTGVRAGRHNSEMIKVAENLWVGNSDDHDDLWRDQGARTSGENWKCICAAKYPWHREALGYTTRAAPKDDPEYLWAERDDRLILNLIDPPASDLIPPILIERALNYIEDNTGAPSQRACLCVSACLCRGRQARRQVLVHCNNGKSRAPAIALLYLFRQKKLPDDPEEAIARFKILYPDYNPGKGIEEFVENYLR